MYQEFLDAASTVLAQGAPAPQPIETKGIGTFLQSQVVPPVLAVGAVMLLGKAMKSNWSGVVTVVMLSLLGLSWLGLSAKPDTAIAVGSALMRLVVPGV